MVTAADYASLIDPTRPYMLMGTLGGNGQRATGNGQRIAPVEDKVLASCRRRGIPGWYPPELLPPLACRYHSALLTISGREGGQQAQPILRSHLGLLHAIDESIARIGWFLALLQSSVAERGLGRRRGEAIPLSCQPVYRSATGRRQGERRAADVICPVR
ncbi:hypothetical protein D3C84_244350 [compost metagenome]